MANPKVELQLSKDLGLTKAEASRLQKGFEKELVDILKAKAAKAKQQLAIRPKVKNEIV